MFCECNSLLSLPDIYKLKTDNITDLTGMFSGIKLLKSLPDEISELDTTNVVNFEGVFFDCQSLISLPDISKWNLNNSICISSFFSGCSSLKALPDISKWNTYNVIYMNDLFNNCLSLTNLPDISKWNTDNTINMSNMFQNCSSLISLPDLSKWDVEKVIQMGSLFNLCSSLKSLPDISNWNVNNIQNLGGLFANCCKSIIDIGKKIEQNKEYYEKIDYFLKALEKIGNDSLIDCLYKETIELYKKKKGFSFLILLFLKIYKKKDLCIELMKIFKEINENPKENEKNMDRKSFLKDYTSKFETIMSESEELLKDYKSIEFYGIILCYLNYYDYENFSLITKKLFKNTPEDLFEILLIYKDHFKYPIQQNLDFFIKFIGYIIEKKDEKKDENKEEKKEEKQDKKKEQKKVEKRVDLEKGLNYIKDLETFLKVIEAKKEDIFEKYNSKKIEKIITLEDLKFKKNFMETEEDEQQLTENSKGNILSIKTTETEKENTEEIELLKKKK